MSGNGLWNGTDGFNGVRLGDTQVCNESLKSGPSRREGTGCLLRRCVPWLWRVIVSTAIAAENHHIPFVEPSSLGDGGLLGSFDEVRAS